MKQPHARPRISYLRHRSFRESFHALPGLPASLINNQTINMKTILLATLALAAIAAPVQAAAKPFVVDNVAIATLDGKIPKGAPVFKKGDVIKLNIKSKKLTGPKRIAIPHLKSSATDVIYSKIIAKQGKADVATVKRSAGQIINVNLAFTRKVASPIPGVTAPGLVTYILLPK
jgi:hypothetical protein